MITLISYIVSRLFSHIWETSCDVILHCYCIDDHIQKKKGKKKAKYPTEKLKKALKHARQRKRGNKNLKDDTDLDEDYL